MVYALDAQRSVSKEIIYYFESNNRNKRSIAMDLKSAGGKEVFLKLIDTDAFLTNMSIDAPIKIGIGPEDLMKRNPRLIYGHSSGWGRKGPRMWARFFYTGIAVGLDDAR